jgi:hypothetical protein
MHLFLTDPFWQVSDMAQSSSGRLSLMAMPRAREMVGGEGLEPPTSSV